jgi:protein ImuB
MPGARGIALFAVDSIAALEGLSPGQPLADARALVPDLRTAPADPDDDRAALASLADWCVRWTPAVSLDGDDGLLLDITGSAHLFGGEERLAEDLVHRLARAHIAARASVASTPGAAWAVARFGTVPVVAPEDMRSALGPLPTAALRLPMPLVETLHRLGLRRVADLLPLPRAPLVARFGAALVRRLDQVLGRAEDPMTPRRPASAWRSRMAFAEPIARREDIEATLRRLLDELCPRLAKARRGARTLELLLCRVDSTAQAITIDTARASHDATHLARLFAEKLDGVDPGFGIETAILEAVTTDRLDPHQTAFEGERSSADVASLIDRLRNRLGKRSVFRVTAVDSHIPERAVTVAPVIGAPTLGPAGERAWPDDLARPIRLLPCPEPIDAEACRATGTLLDFEWRGVRHRIARTEGPERIAPEWWRAAANARTRDYYRVEDDAGRRFWVYRTLPRDESETSRWYLHGLFA